MGKHIRTGGIMTIPAILLCFILLSNPVFGRDEFGNFVSKYKAAIESYIMVGYGGGWDMCDFLIVTPLKSDFPSEDPQIVQEIDELKTLDVFNSFASSHCIIVTALAHDNASFSTLIEFGWSAIQHKRVGMILRLGSNLALDKAANITKLPFVIAAQLESGKEQFLCPTVGSYQPLFQLSMCQQHLTDYRGKTIRVPLFIGFYPYGYRVKNIACTRNCSVPDGVDFRFLKVLQAKMNFTVKISGVYWLQKQAFKLVQLKVNQ